MSTRAMPVCATIDSTLRAIRPGRVADVADVERPERVAHHDQAALGQVPLEQVQRSARREVAVDDQHGRLRGRGGRGVRRAIVRVPPAQRAKRALGPVSAQQLPQIDRRVPGVGDAPRDAAGDLAAEALGPRAQLVPPVAAAHVTLMSRVARLAQAVLAQELAQVLAVDLGGARRRRQVPLVALDSAWMYSRSKPSTSWPSLP